MESIRLTRAQVYEIDRRCVEAGLSIETLMERAGAAVAEEAVKMILPGTKVLIVCGGGNNGGDGYVAARLLAQRGIDVTILFDEPGSKPSAAFLLNVNRAQSLRSNPATPAAMMRADPGLIIDALLGVGLTGAPRTRAGELIDAINAAGVPILSIDIPSGLDCDTGTPLGPCIRATKTITFIAPKAGFTNPDSKRHTGEVIVADIGAPREIIEEVAM